MLDQVAGNYKEAYCHVYEWLYTGFGLVIGFVDHSQIVTTINYSTLTNSLTQQFTTTCTKSSQTAVSLPVIARWQLRMADVSLTLDSWTIPVPQLPASVSNGSQGLNHNSPVTHSLTHQPTCSTSLHCTALTELSLSLSLMLRPTVSRPVCLGIKHPSGLTTRFFFSVRNVECVW
jgi:hypothetical protein